MSSGQRSLTIATFIQLAFLTGCGQKAAAPESPTFSADIADDAEINRHGGDATNKDVSKQDKDGEETVGSSDASELPPRDADDAGDGDAGDGDAGDGGSNENEAGGKDAASSSDNNGDDGNMEPTPPPQASPTPSPLAEHEATVGSWYQRFLQREPDAVGLADFAGRLLNGETPNNVLASILGSKEYFGLHGDNYAQFVRGAYQQITSNQPSTVWVNLQLTYLKLHPGPTGRAEVARRILTQQFPNGVPAF